jgi:RNA polymerase sigma factor (sigma-70 family)
MAAEPQELLAFQEHQRRSGGTERAQTDAQLLQEFVARHDQSAFAQLLQRHGPLVWGICRRVLHNADDADDAFQATFLILARKARLVRTSVAGWLCRVAYRVAANVKSNSAQRRLLEKQAAAMSKGSVLPDGASDAGWKELRPVLDEELDRLPEKYRLPIVLCYMQRKTNDEAAEELGWTRGTIAGRLSRARDLLRARLTRRGVVLSGAVLAMLVSKQAATAAVPATLLQTTAQVTTVVVASNVAAAGLVSAPVAALADAGVKALGMVKLKIATALVAASVALGGVAATAYYLQAPAASVQQNPPASLAAYQEVVLAAAFSPTSRLAATGGLQSTVTVWDLASGQERITFGKHDNSVTSVSFSPDGATLATASWDDHLRVWDPATGRQKGSVYAHRGGADAVVFSPDGLTLASCGGDHGGEQGGVHPELSGPGEVKLWDAATLRLKATLTGHVKWIHSLAFTPDGKTLASGSEDGTVRLWDVAGSRTRLTLRGHRSGIRCVAISPDGAMLASSSRDGTVKLWDMDSGLEKRTLRADFTQVWSVAFSPDGRTLVSAGDDMLVKLWDVPSGRKKATLAGHTGWIMSVAFSPDGQTLLTAGSDRGVKLWDMTTLKEKKGP